MIDKRLKLLLVTFCFFIPKNIFCQQLNASDTSESSIKRIQALINQNRELVKFIEYSLKSKGIPKHMRNLAIIESSLDHRVVSHAGAKGLWQFMVEHANHYGLADRERSDIYKSTKTVVHSLIHLYNQYGNWVTVVAAYNCGEGNIRKAMRKAGSKKYTDFVRYLPAETQGHVKKFLNACYATGELDEVLEDYYKTSAAPKTANLEIPKKYIRKNPKKEFSETVLNSAYNLDTIAEILNIPKSQILNWNPEVEKNLAEKGESLLYLPADIMFLLESNRTKILSESLKK